MKHTHYVRSHLHNMKPNKFAKYGFSPKFCRGACHVTLRLAVKVYPNRFRFTGVISEKVNSHDRSICFRHINISSLCTSSPFLRLTMHSCVVDIEARQTQRIEADSQTFGVVRGKNTWATRRPHSLVSRLTADICLFRTQTVSEK